MVEQSQDSHARIVALFGGGSLLDRLAQLLDLVHDLVVDVARSMRRVGHEGSRGGGIFDYDDHRMGLQEQKAAQWRALPKGVDQLTHRVPEPLASLASLA